MKSFWQASKQLLGGYPCVEHVVTKELSIIGRYGEIWQHDKLTFKAIIYSHRISKRYLPQEEWPIHAEDETLILFSAKELVTATTEARRVSSDQAASGTANRSVFLESEASMLSAQADLLRAEFDRSVAAADLARLTGNR